MNSKAVVPRTPAAEPLRVLVLGAGVIGSVYAARLIQVVVVPGRAGQLAATSPVLAGMTDASDVLFFGSTAGLCLRMPPAFAIRYWRRVLASPRGELMFVARSRAEPEGNTRLGPELRAAVHRSGRPAPAPGALLSPRAAGGVAL